MSGKIMISVPFYQDLATRDGWTAYPKPNHKYFVARCHYLLKPRQERGAVRMGDIIDSYSTTPGVEVKRVESLELEYTRIDFRSFLDEALREDTSVREFAATLGSAAGSDATGKITNSVKSSARDTLKNSFKNTFKVEATDNYRTKHTVTLEYSLDPEKFPAKGSVVACHAYVSRCYDLYLAYVDYLTVEYKRSALGVLLKRHKYPEAGNLQRHPNIIKFELPLVTLQYWSLLPTAKLVSEADYRLEVEDSSEIIMAPLDRGMPVADFDPKPTLYQLAEKAFRERVIQLSLGLH